MEIKRSEIMPGVNLAYLWSDKFKTSCMSLTLLTQLQRDTASMNALIPLVLRRGTTRYPDMEAISARLDELYGTAIEPGRPPNRRDTVPRLLRQHTGGGISPWK